jgi:[ribosomal protein S5]-alanine N-acetyltransferase
MTLLETCGGSALRIRGDKIWLRALSPADIGPRYLRWLNDPEINEFSSRHNRTFVEEDLFAYLESANASDNRLLLGIFTNEEDIHVGNVLIHIVDLNAGVADLSNLIGEREYWGRGIIKDADSQAIHFGFQVLGLAKFVMGNIAPHRASTFKSTSLGARLEAKLRGQALFGDKRVDVLRFGLLPEEFYDAHPGLRDRKTWDPDVTPLPAGSSGNAGDR